MRNKLEWFFDYYNKKYFKNKLPTAKVKWDKKLLRREDSLGVLSTYRCGCKPKKHKDVYKIYIAKELNFSSKITKQVLLHEMVHLDLKHTNDKTSHGPKFHARMLKLCKQGAMKKLW
jgi:predicted metal-dependent hydrolase